MGSTGVKWVLIGITDCLVFDLVVVFVYLLFYNLMMGFLEETALALCLHSVQHTGILSHATPTYYGYLSNNQICVQLSFLSSTSWFKPFSSSFSRVLSETLWIVPTIVLSFSELSAACLVTRSTVYLHTSKSSVLNRSRSCFLCSEDFKKTWTTNNFAKCWNFYLLS